MFSYQKKNLLQTFIKITNRAMSSDSQIQNTLKTIFLKSVEAVKPAVLVENSLKIEKSADSLLLKVSDNNKQTSIIDITHRNVYCVGFGKAVHGMAVAVEKALSTKLRSGVISIPKKLNAQHMQSSSVIKVRCSSVHICSPRLDVGNLISGA
jgi:glycerate-2-kinase